MIEKVRSYIEKYHMLDKNDKVVIGVSGGADSVALFLLLNAWKEAYELQISVVHINHGIRQEAKEDAEYVEALCREYGAGFYLFEEDIPTLASQWKMTEEEAGRQCRYQHFYEVMEQVGAKKLFVAHHMDDQAETVLFHLVRGARLAGMEGMQPVSDVNVQWKHGETMCSICRPMLLCRKAEITDWLKLQSVSWKEDWTNTEDTYARNRIRNRIIPELETINHQAVRHITDFSLDLAEYQMFFQEIVNGYVKEHVLDKQADAMCETDRHLLKQQPPVLARAVIYEMLGMVCGRKRDITASHVQDIYDLMSNQSGKKVMLPYQMIAEVSYEKLIIRQNLNENICTEWEWLLDWQAMEKQKGAKCDVELPFGGRLELCIYQKNDCSVSEWAHLCEQVINSKNNYTKFFDCGTIVDTLYVRTPQAGDYMVIREDGKRKKLSRYFIDCKVPVQQRNRQLVVALGQEVLWVVKGRRGENYKVKDSTECILKMTYKGE